MKIPSLIKFIIEEKMKTPIIDFVKNYNALSPLRLHMPGHKGREYLGFESADITEIDGADVLYSADGIIRESMDNASRLFGTADTLYSAEGSSLCIRAMMYLVLSYAKSFGKKPLVLAGRNAHKVFVMSAGLLDIDVKWLYGEKSDSLVSCNITAEGLECTLCKMTEKPVCVYITSPDYLGNILDVGAISQVCKKHGILLFVDNAHGAYLGFLQKNRHPIQLGSDVCCDSAHKTLSALTGAAYLHISKNAPSFFTENASSAMSLFASTSPSYLILQSLDLQNKLLSEDYPERLLRTCDRVQTLKEKIRGLGFELYGNEPLKITIASKSYGYRGFELADILKKSGVYPEFYDPDFVVLMVSPENDRGFEERFLHILESVEKRMPINEPIPEIPILKREKSIRDALFSNSERLPVDECLGRYLTTPTVSCPPAVPIAVCGEIIDERALRLFRYYNQEWAEVGVL